MSNPDSFPAGETVQMLSGPAGQIEAILASPKAQDAAPEAKLTVVCHPHSLMGGTMNNKVVHTIARAHRAQGHHVVRFNFRGVGHSEGQYDAGNGESDDLMAVLDWGHQVLPEASVCLAGFSFGSYVAARTLNRAIAGGVPIEQLILVAPAVENYDFDQLTSFGCPVGVIWGDSDEVVDPQAMEYWYDQITSRKKRIILPGAGHFFHGRLTDLKQALAEVVG